MDTVLSVAEAVDSALLARIIPQFYTAEQWLDIAALESKVVLVQTLGEAECRVAVPSIPESGHVRDSHHRAITSFPKHISKPHQIVVGV